MSNYAQSNVGLGMVPCKKNCRCSDCQIDHLRAEIERLREALVKIRHGDEKTMYERCPDCHTDACNVMRCCQCMRLSPIGIIADEALRGEVE